MARISNFRVGKQKKCWCDSGKKWKNCHGAPARAAEQRTDTSKASAITRELSGFPFGLPGEEHKLWTVPVRKGESPVLNFRGSPGKYKVQILLSRPSVPLWKEREHRFIDNELGDSHIRIAKPIGQRRPEDTDYMLLQANTPLGQITFRGLPNPDGCLGKFVADDFWALGFDHAESTAYGALAPFLSAWSLNMDIPVNVHTVQVTEVATYINSVRVRTPQLEMSTPAGLSPILSDEFCHYASLYREAQNSNSPFYRFLCLFKIIESITTRRNRINKERSKQGLSVIRHPEIIPEQDQELTAILRQVYTWRTDWNGIALEELFPKQSRGKRVSQIVDTLNKIRVSIAHALLKSGEITISIDALPDIQEVNSWLPLCRIVTRWLLRNDFPEQFEFSPKELPPAVLEQMRASVGSSC